MARRSSEKTWPYVLEYGDAPQSLNDGGTGSRRHWGAAHREKKKWQEIWGTLLMGAGIPRHMSYCRVEASITFREKRRRDAENYRPAISKPLADALVTGLWLPDDTEDFFELGRLSLQAGQGDGWYEHFPPGVKAKTRICLFPTY